MKIIRNKYENIQKQAHPFQGFKGGFCGILFVRGNAKIDDVTMNHESVHSKAMDRMWSGCIDSPSSLILIGLWWLWLILSVFAFYILYGIEWFIKLFIYRNSHKAYKNTSFEREAYSNEDDVIYLESRKRFAWIKYIK